MMGRKVWGRAEEIWRDGFRYVAIRVGAERVGYAKGTVRAWVEEGLVRATVHVYKNKSLVYVRWSDVQRVAAQKADAKSMMRQAVEWFRTHPKMIHQSWRVIGRAMERDGLMVGRATVDRAREYVGGAGKWWARLIVAWMHEDPARRLAPVGEVQRAMQQIHGITIKRCSVQTGRRLFDQRWGTEMVLAEWMSLTEAANALGIHISGLRRFKGALSRRVRFGKKTYLSRAQVAALAAARQGQIGVMAGALAKLREHPEWWGLKVKTLATLLEVSTSTAAICRQKVWEGERCAGG